MTHYLHRLLLAFFAAFIPMTAHSSVMLKPGTRYADIIPADKFSPDANGNVLVGDMIFHVGPSILSAFPGNIWPNGVILYRFESSLSQDKRSNFIAACQAWTIGTPLTCRERSSETGYIYVKEHNGEQCGGPYTGCSLVGYQGGPQDLFIYKDAWNSSYLLQHEIGHAIGLIHEHQRPDRDSYVYIVYDNVQDNQQSQFTLFGDVVSMNTQYDYLSIMHYSNCLFAKNPGCTLQTPQFQTIVPKPCSLDEVGGGTITTLDYDGVRNAYSRSLQAVLVRDQFVSCGVLQYDPVVFQAVCAPNCVTIGTTSYKKVDVIYQDWCGYMSALPSNYEPNQCIPSKKTYIDSWWDHDDFSCGRLHAETRHELWVRCGCPIVNTAATCTNINKFSTGTYEESKPNLPDWKSGRVVYFRDIMDQLQADGVLGQDVIARLGNFYQINYLDPRFETKLMRVRAGVYSLARWKKSIDPSYTMTAATFTAIVARRKLRWH
ncbi:hypothetical protein EOD23_07330 [Mesorhizobium sp. USDA-HM6]|nr:hypothetical protein EOD23_07330 [Mesorhizobium sp. USDA-HM6]